MVHGKGSLLDQMPGDLWQKFANLRLLYGYMWTHPGKKLLFMGGEFGQWNEWNYDASCSGTCCNGNRTRACRRWWPTSTRCCAASRRCTKSISSHTGFEWIDCHNCDDSVLAFIRKAKDPSDFLVVAATSRPSCRDELRIGVPERCWYEEVFNSDSTFYGGSNLGNGPGIMAEEPGWHGRPAKVRMKLPPLALSC